MAGKDGRRNGGLRELRCWQVDGRGLCIRTCVQKGLRWVGHPASFTSIPAAALRTQGRGE